MNNGIYEYFLIISAQNAPALQLFKNQTRTLNLAKPNKENWGLIITYQHVCRPLVDERTGRFKRPY